MAVARKRRDFKETLKWIGKLSAFFGPGIWWIIVHSFVKFSQYGVRETVAYRWYKDFIYQLILFIARSISQWLWCLSIQIISKTKICLTCLFGLLQNSFFWLSFNRLYMYIILVHSPLPFSQTYCSEPMYIVPWEIDNPSDPWLLHVQEWVNQSLWFNRPSLWHSQETHQMEPQRMQKRPRIRYEFELAWNSWESIQSDDVRAWVHQKHPVMRWLPSPEHISAIPRDLITTIERSSKIWGGKIFWASKKIGSSSQSKSLCKRRNSFVEHVRHLNCARNLAKYQLTMMVNTAPPMNPSHILFERNEMNGR